MPHIISFINLKGGVGKTTTLVQVADALSSLHGRRVLVIDLDPQTNATIALIGEDRWLQCDQAGQTLAQLFIDKLEGTDVFDPERATIRKVSNLPTSTLDLIPSSLKLIDVQDRMSDISYKTSYTMSPIDVVKLTLQPILSQYDYVLIDCPPNLGYITQNGLEISDWYVIPTIPDRLSTYGIPQIIRRVEKLRRDRKLKVRCLGLVLTKVQSNSSSHDRTKRILPAQLQRAFEEAGAAPATMFETSIPQANAFADAVDYSRGFISFKEKYGRSLSGGQALYEYAADFAKELMNRVEA
ncbi:ParA family protein [Deinococcus yavapaiensis]|uniref:Chromosome partitioning protein n=1 Tax=Deinococcus yavapaiensis KR-236 TaxID=694435 RepID=A0A318S6D0_9DEIO|nr:ParA family protein [Deinococcus yavapaiensis]PYE53277.1 chromosome partitioning protein [Deinococcus yavapaiensis KR-236]